MPTLVGQCQSMNSNVQKCHGVRMKRLNNVFTSSAGPQRIIYAYLQYLKRSCVKNLQLYTPFVVVCGVQPYRRGEDESDEHEGREG
jgi:hypothetical protein